MHFLSIKLGALLIGVIALSFYSGLGENLDTMTKKLYIMPIGKVDKDALAYLQNNLCQRFNLRCHLLEPIKIPDEALNKKRRQYYSPSILQAILSNAPSDYHRILGIVEVDLYVPGLNFIFGQAEPRQGIALISLTRLKQEYYGLSPNKEIFQQRMLKEAVHELGHTYRLGHCSNPRCVMYFSNSLMDTDRKGADFCPQCREKVEAHLKNN